MENIRVLFTIGGLHPESGGPSQSVPALAAALAEAGVETGLVSLHYGEDWRSPEIQSRKIQTTFVRCDGALSQRLQWTPRFPSALEKACVETRAQIIHDTGLWLSTNHASSQVASKLGLPRIVSPRGMLSGWALQHKGWKKRLAWTLYQRRDIENAQVLHATSQAEAEEFRAAGLKQPIAVIPNGVELPPMRDKSEVRSQKSEVRTLLFLSRLHPKKGLAELAKAWALVKPEGWKAVIAGGDEDGCRAQIESLIRSLGVEKDFEFVGAVGNEEKWGYYRRADLFVLPSHSENFGIVVAEALACGVPVIATRGTPWEDLRTHRCGWWCEDSVEQLSATLREATALPDEVRREMGLCGRDLVAKKYSWPEMAARMKSVYEWMLGQGAKPGCVKQND